MIEDTSSASAAPQSGAGNASSLIDPPVIHQAPVIPSAEPAVGDHDYRDTPSDASSEHEDTLAADVFNPSETDAQYAERRAKELGISSSSSEESSSSGEPLPPGSVDESQSGGCVEPASSLPLGVQSEQDENQPPSAWETARLLLRALLLSVNTHCNSAGANEAQAATNEAIAALQATGHDTSGARRLFSHIQAAPAPVNPLPDTYQAPTETTASE